MLMKYLKMLSLAMIICGLTNCANAATPTSSQSKAEQTMDLPFKLYPTENMWTFIKLDTRNGKMWQVQYSTKGSDYRYEIPLNFTELFDGKTVGRFELYPTKNMYNFVLLDRIEGSTWQVQWSTEPDERFVVPIQSIF